MRHLEKLGTQFSIPISPDDDGYLGGLLRTPQRSMTWLGHAAPDTVAQLKKAGEFGVSNEPDVPLALWYGGMLAACDNIEKILMRLH